MKVGFAIPAHNEEQLLPGTIRAIHGVAGSLALDYAICVADDGSTDSTPAIARAEGARVVHIEARKIAAARNAAARSLGPVDVLVFVDADTRISETAVRLALAALASGAAGGGASVEFDGEIPRWARIAVVPVNALFKSLKICGGCFLFCTRAAYERAGGWDEAYFASEEIHFAKALKKVGKFVILPCKVQTSGRKLRTHTLGEIARTLAACTLRPSWLKTRERLEIWYGERRPEGK